MNTETQFDLAVVGSGAAAFAAAIAARREGLAVVMIEQGDLGGTCVNSGCVPSKALAAAAAARQVACVQRFPGLATTAGAVDLGAVLSGTNDLVAAIRTEKYVDVAAAHGWSIRSGTARFTDESTLQVVGADGRTSRVEADRYLIATGATPAMPAIDGLAPAGYLTSTTALGLRQLPASMIVIGGSAGGLELAQVFARLGTRVTVLEARTRLVPVEEPEISAGIADILAADGISVHLDVTPVQVRRVGTDRVVRVRTRSGHAVDVSAEQVLIATGRRPATSELGLDAAGVKTGTGGEVVVDEFFATTNSRIWAAGDVTGGPQFVYVAAAQGTAAAENALFSAGRTLDYSALPRVTFTSPAIASVGLTDAQAGAAGMACECRAVALTQVARARVDRCPPGLIKLVAQAGTGRLLGAHVLAAGAGEVIAAAGYAIAAGLTIDQLAHGWSPYLTMAEGLKLAALAFTNDIAQLSCCAG